MTNQIGFVKTDNSSPIQPDNKTTFLTDDNGNQSAIRLMSFVALIASIVLAVYTVVGVKDNKELGSVGTNLTFLFLTYAFTGKVAQKFAEKMGNE